MAQPSRARPVLQFSAGGLVVDDRGQILLIRARDLRDQPVWTLPKGALNPGESSADAAVREVREETGLPVSIAEDPLASVCLGTGRMLTDFDLLRRVAIE